MQPTKFPSAPKSTPKILNLYVTKMKAQQHISTLSPAPSPLHQQDKVAFRKERRHFTRKLHNLEHKLQEERRRTQVLTQENITLKKTRHEHIQTIRAHEYRMTELERQTQDLQAALRKKSTLLHSLETQNSSSNLQNLRSEMKHLLQRNQTLIQANTQLQEIASDLRQKLMQENCLHLEYTQEATKLHKQIVGTTAELNALKKQLDEQKRYVQELETGLSVPQLISLLDEKLKMATLPEYAPLDALARRTKALWRLYYRKQRHSPTPTHPSSRKTETRFGHLRQTDDKWEFQCLEGNTFPVLPTERKLVHGAPTKAELVNGQAIILQSFPVRPHSSEPSTQPITKAAKGNHASRDLPTNRDEESFDFHSCMGLKVLIVGARGKNVYIHTLQSHVLEVTWHNPFEESHELLRGKFNQADIVLICKRHISHSAMHQIDKSNPKVELMGNDNPRKMLIRIRFAGIRLGLLQPGRG